MRTQYTKKTQKKHHFTTFISKKIIALLTISIISIGTILFYNISSNEQNIQNPTNKSHDLFVDLTENIEDEPLDVTNESDEDTNDSLDDGRSVFSPSDNNSNQSRNNSSNNNSSNNKKSTKPKPLDTNKTNHNKGDYDPVEPSTPDKDDDNPVEPSTPDKDDDNPVEPSTPDKDDDNPNSDDSNTNENNNK